MSNDRDETPRTLSELANFRDPSIERYFDATIPGRAELRKLEEAHKDVRTGLDGLYYRPGANGSWVLDENLSRPQLEEGRRADEKRAADQRAAAEAAERSRPTAEQLAERDLVERFWSGDRRDFTERLHNAIAHQHPGVGLEPRDAGSRGGGGAGGGDQGPTELYMSNTGNRYRIEADGSLTLTELGKHHHGLTALMGRVTGGDAETLKANFLSAEELAAHKRAMARKR